MRPSRKDMAVGHRISGSRPRRGVALTGATHRDGRVGRATHRCAARPGRSCAPGRAQSCSTPISAGGAHWGHTPWPSPHHRLPGPFRRSGLDPL